MAASPKAAMEQGRLDFLANSGDAADMAYPGGKNGAGVYQRLINLMPPHSVYIEPFLGGGAIMRAKRPAALNIGLDLDRAAVRAFKQSLRDPLSPHRAMDQARFQIRVGDGLQYLRSCKFSGSELVYCDPPYLMETRRSERPLYRYEFSAGDHRRLLRVVMALPCRVMISGYWSELYAAALQDWNHIEYSATTRGGSVATEHVWFNYAEPLELHDYRYLGETFRERERITRKKTRWAARLGRMSLLERRALLDAIAGEWGGGARE